MNQEFVAGERVSAGPGYEQGYLAALRPQCSGPTGIFTVLDPLKVGYPLVSNHPAGRYLSCRGKYFTFREGRDWRQ